jgi:uncharacterized membrane protein (DUF106 family)|tara:strand:- start:948 stop:1559 length:612 start_codon:yes stop_codon:yes gene_type:complete
MKRLKEEMKELQKEAKELKSEPEKAMQVQKQVMQTNMKYMMQSFRSMIYTMVPIIIIFSWMSANLAYDPILPGQDFTTTIVFEKGTSGSVELSVPNGIIINGDGIKEVKDSEIKWVLEGDAGEYLLEYIFDGKTYSKEVLVTKENRYITPVKTVKKDVVKSISIDNNPKKLLNFGFWKPGWLGTYIIFSIVFSILVRKIIKVY